MKASQARLFRRMALMPLAGVVLPSIFICKEATLVG
jgi:hypothetical protein